MPFAQTADGLPVVVDVPIWFADLALEDVPITAALARRVDGVVLMAYGTDVSRRERLLAAAMDRLSAVGTQFWIGLSAAVRHLCPDPVIETLEADISDVEDSMALVPGFAGVAVHDFDRYRDLILGVSNHEPLKAKAGCLQAAQKKKRADG